MPTIQLKFAPTINSPLVAEAQRFCAWLNEMIFLPADIILTLNNNFSSPTSLINLIALQVIARRDALMHSGGLFTPAETWALADELLYTYQEDYPDFDLTNDTDEVTAALAPQPGIVWVQVAPDFQDDNYRAELYRTVQWYEDNYPIMRPLTVTFAPDQAEQVHLPHDLHQDLRLTINLTPDDIDQTRYNFFQAMERYRGWLQDQFFGETDLTEAENDALIATEADNILAAYREAFAHALPAQGVFFPQTVTTSRLVLRSFEEDDAPALYELAKDPAIGPIAGWPVHTSVADSRANIINFLQVAGTYAVTDRASGQLLGAIGLKLGENSVSHYDDEPELGYWIGKPYWGQGLIPEASRALIDLAFKQLHFKAIWLCHRADNPQSARVAEKLGFTPVSTRQIKDLTGKLVPDVVNVLRHK